MIGKIIGVEVKMMDGKMRTLKAGAVALLMIVAIFLAIAPGVGAQNAVQPEFIYTNPGRPIKPQQEMMVIPFEVKITREQLAAGSEAGTVVATVTATPDVSWLTVSISPTQFFWAGQDDAAKQGYLSVIATTLAPATVQGKILISITTDGSGAGTVTYKDYTAQVPIEPAFFSLLSVTAATTLQKISPNGQAVYPITVTNLGNGPTKVFLDIKNVPTGWQVVTPAPFILDSTQQGGKNTKATVNVMVQPPYKFGHHNDLAAMKIDITSTHALDSSLKGDASAVSIMTRSQGMCTPGFEALFVFAALGCFMLISKKKKKE
ncbi:MAG: hypothetical protein CVT48_02115 [Thermoplasmata archaeon HGW-Thermoplasmata-1]|nr:MAG: hypothetical protein CVT48_02115 [Thermoplasmata archaeon HGW-Thermoplasmata-1]